MGYGHDGVYSVGYVRGEESGTSGCDLLLSLASFGVPLPGMLDNPGKLVLACEWIATGPSYPPLCASCWGPLLART